MAVMCGRFLLTAPSNLIAEHFGVEPSRTIAELRGRPCLEVIQGSLFDQPRIAAHTMCPSTCL